VLGVFGGVWGYSKSILKEEHRRIYRGWGKGIKKI